MSTPENCGAGSQMTFEEICGELRTDINRNAVRLLELRCHKRFAETEGYVGQHSEMIANIMLAFRHLEDARMRVGKILQYAGNGTSILDRPEVQSCLENIRMQDLANEHARKQQNSQ